MEIVPCQNRRLCSTEPPWAPPRGHETRHIGRVPHGGWGETILRPCPSASRMATYFVKGDGARIYPYWICCPWVRGWWGLDALGKFFRRRRRRPLLLRQFLENINMFSHLSWSTDFWGYVLFDDVVFQKHMFVEGRTYRLLVFALFRCW